jgi:hypothetical protein
MLFSSLQFDLRRSYDYGTIQGWITKSAEDMGSRSEVDPSD